MRDATMASAASCAAPLLDTGPEPRPARLSAGWASVSSPPSGECSCSRAGIKLCDFRKADHASVSEGVDEGVLLWPHRAEPPLHSLPTSTLAAERCCLEESAIKNATNIPAQPTTRAAPLRKLILLTFWERSWLFPFVFFSRKRATWRPLFLHRRRKARGSRKRDADIRQKGPAVPRANNGIS